LIWIVFAGIGFLTVGIIGIGRLYIKNHRNLFTAIAFLLIPLLTVITIMGAYGFIISIAPMLPMRSEITQVTVVDNSPLALSVGVTAITSRDSRIEGVIVLNGDDEIIAETSFDDREWLEGYALAVLPAGSEITLTLNFNTILPADNYLVRLTCWHQNHGSSLFTIP
jgi:hypothetical protein